MQTFSLFDNQHGSFTANPVDSAGNPSSISGEQISVDGPGILSVSATAFANQVDVRALGAVGTATVTVTGTNAANDVITSQFAFVVSLSPATSFTGTFTGLANN